MLFAKATQYAAENLMTGILQAWTWLLTIPLPQEPVNPLVKQNSRKKSTFEASSQSSFAFTNNHIFIHIHNHTQNPKDFQTDFIKPENELRRIMLFIQGTSVT